MDILRTDLKFNTTMADQNAFTAGEDPVTVASRDAELQPLWMCSAAKSTFRVVGNFMKLSEAQIGGGEISGRRG